MSPSAKDYRLPFGHTHDPAAANMSAAVTSLAGTNPHMQREQLDFRRTLDVLASWKGSTVLVTAHSQPHGEPRSHAHTVLRGGLGDLTMVDADVDPEAESSAGYVVGEAPNGLYMRAADFVEAVRVGESHLTVRFRGDLNFEIRRLE
jgi:hypothetical protein